MKAGKYTVAIVLMVVSIILLVALQFFWILNSYEKVHDGLRRETNLLFHTSAMSIKNATWMRKIESLSRDSSTQGFRIVYHDTTKMRSQAGPKTLRKNIEVVIRGNARKEDITLRRLQLPQDDTAQAFDRSRVILDFRNDALNIDTLRKSFFESLLQAQINVPFNILQRKKSETPENDFIARRHRSEKVILDYHEEIAIGRSDGNESIFKILSADTIRLLPVHTSPFHEYSASLYNVRGMLVKQIMPQILFSLFLTFMIGGAFLLMFRNFREQQRLMHAKNEFIGNISHELKTPVATMSVVLEALKTFHAIDNPQLTQEYLGIAQSELNRLSIMTDKILRTAVFEDKGVEYEPEIVDLNAIISQVLVSMKLVLEKNSASVNFITEGADFHVMGSPVHLTNVIYNLIDNALKYCIVEPRILITISVSYDVVLIRIKDNGIGIDHPYQKKIFEKFFRIPTGDLHNTKGYGLGLNYVATVISRHRGTILVESELTTGSEFNISLPRVVRHT